MVNERLTIILVILGIAFALLVIWMMVYGKKRFKKITDWIEELIDSVLAVP